VEGVSFLRRRREAREVPVNGAGRPPAFLWFRFFFFSRGHGSFFSAYLFFFFDAGVASFFLDTAELAGFLMAIQGSTPFFSSNLSEDGVSGLLFWRFFPYRPGWDFFG